MCALRKIIKMRGGSQHLEWDEVLQIFISWWVTAATKLDFWIMKDGDWLKSFVLYRQHLLPSAMLSMAFLFSLLPICLIIQGETPSCSPIHPELGTSTELRAVMISNFNDMRQLTELLTSIDHPITLIELISLDSVRCSLDHCLLAPA